jgi:predicted TIM-barrel fold metal-dependent hydrolase
MAGMASPTSAMRAPAALPNRRSLAFRIVDAHHHLWDLRRPGYEWLRGARRMEPILGNYEAICRDYTLAMFKREGAPVGLSKSVHIETAEGADPVIETEWLQQMADADPEGYPHAIVGAADLTTAVAEEVIQRHLHHRNFRGVRMLTNNGAKFLSHPAFRRNLGLLAKYRLNFDVDADFPLFAEFAEVAASTPEVTFILGHAGFPRERTAAYFNKWRDALGLLALQPNCACKISGLGMVDHAWTVATLKPWIIAAIEAFGTERVMFASNWPVDSLFSSYEALFAAYAAVVADRWQAELPKLFATNAERIYRI